MMQGTVHDRFSLYKLPEHCIYRITDESRFDYKWWMAKNCWRSVDAHFHDGAGNMALSLFRIKAAKTLIMHTNYQITSELPYLQDQKSLTLRWCSYSEWRREHVALSFSLKASQYHIYEWPQLIAMQITNDARPKIVDAPLTLIFRMGQGVCGSFFCLKSQPIPHLWMAANNRHADYQWCKSKNRWRSIDADSAMGISTISYHVIRPNISLLVFWHPLYSLHVCSPSSLHWSLLIHINISIKIYFEVSAKCR